jgi:hypothetical protein
MIGFVGKIESLSFGKIATCSCPEIADWPDTLRQMTDAPLVPLSEDPSYDGTPVDIGAIEQALLKPVVPESPPGSMRDSCEFLLKEKANLHLVKPCTYFQYKIPALLEGPTGTFKCGAFNRSAHFLEQT